MFTANGTSKTYKERQQDTKAKKDFLEARGYQVVSIYSCEFRAEQEADPEMKEFVERMRERLRQVFIR